jgi:hypothetical protein
MPKIHKMPKIKKNKDKLNNALLMHFSSDG